MKEIVIDNRKIGPGHSVFVIAELSANHHGDFGQTVEMLHAAKEAGADAVKVQTYTADTLTIDSDREYFRIGKGTLWEGQTLHNLYKTASMPWGWQPKLKEICDQIGIIFFSTPFDSSAFHFLEEMKVKAHKIASFELVDIPLIRLVASSGKPLIMSTGMATVEEIDEAVQAARETGTGEIVLLKCTSAYPSPPEAMNLRTLPDLSRRYDVSAGLSDHTLGVNVPVVAVSLGATVIEKHFTLSRAISGPDSMFSLEPAEFRQMVEAVHIAERSLGQVVYGPQPDEEATRVFRRSLFVVCPIRKGELLTKENVRSIRPAHGLAPKYADQVYGRLAACDIPAGTPLAWEHFLQ